MREKISLAGNLSRQKVRNQAMTNLKCTVESCIYNCPGRCCKPEIKVEGPMACDCEQTCCASFENKSAGGAMNSRGYNTPNEALQVACAAENCVYNHSGECSADSISITPCSCSTPDCKSATECASFRMK